MLASLALLSACNKESNEPVVQQEQKAKSGVSISMSGQIELPEELARGLEFQAFPGKNGGTSYTPFFNSTDGTNSTDIPALVCFYNDYPDATTENAPYVMRQVVLGIHNVKGSHGRMVSSFYFKQDNIDENGRIFQDHLKNPGARRDQAKVNTNPENLRMTLIVGFGVKGGNRNTWDNNSIHSDETSYQLGKKVDLTQPINYWVDKDAQPNIARPIFAAFDVQPSGVADGKIAFSNVKLTMVGSIIKARIENNDTEPHKIVGFKIENVGRSALKLEPPTRVEIPESRKKRLVPPAIVTDRSNPGKRTELWMWYEFPQEDQRVIRGGYSDEWLVYLPLNKTQSGGRADGPIFSVMYDPVNAVPEYGVTQKLKPLKRDGLIVSHTFTIKRRR